MGECQVYRLTDRCFYPPYVVKNLPKVLCRFCGKPEPTACVACKGANYSQKCDDKRTNLVGACQRSKAK